MRTKKQMSIERVVTKDGQTKIILTHPNSSEAHIYLHGAHATFFKNENGKEFIMLSENAIFNDEKAIRGGVPVCFPQFSMEGPLSLSHGFARVSNDWVVVGEELSDDAVSVTLRLSDNERTLSMWDKKFELDIQFVVEFDNQVGTTLFRQEMSVLNTGDVPLEFTAALHAYFNVDDVRSTTIGPVQGLEYFNKLSGDTLVSEDNLISFTSETDRVYYDSPNTMYIMEEDKDDIILIEKDFPEAVVWNCWEEKSVSMGDMGDNDWTRYVCLEPAVIKNRPLVPPGETTKYQYSMRSASKSDIQQNKL
eukprot:TRINITY_DN164_c0_g1_i1.p1 TRINITY_DN164_c0_g1~~TRINITY_DN164_c0_g1_i1.p1  ORF type:complete len:306 (-),score=78.51 TRINITY_DN164_c0_g1_i1:34-951(-)